MFRKVGIGLLSYLLLVTSAYSQNWAQKMFTTTYHDFGTIARGAKAEFQFPFSDIYLEDVHVAGVQSSCGCTNVQVKKANLKTYEKGAIIASINSDAFFGKRAATITVTFDQPMYAEVQLQVAADIRTDVTVSPGSVQFGSVEQGTTWQQQVTVYHEGNSDWQVVGVKSANPKLRVTAMPAGQQYGQAWYNLTVDLDKSTPAGYFRDHVMLITNDPQESQIPVLVEGNVQASVSVTPLALFLGVVQPGQQVVKQVVIKASKPFRVMGIECDDSHFKFDAKDAVGAEVSKTIQIVPIIFTADAKMGKVLKSIRIQTDLDAPLPAISAQAIVADNVVTKK